MMQSRTWIWKGALVAALVYLGTNAARANVADVNFHNWTFEMAVQELDNGNPTGPLTPVTAAGDALVRFDAPFDMGTEQNPLPVPPGPQGDVQVEILSMDLSGTGFPGFGGPDGGFSMSLGTAASQGLIDNLVNLGGVLTGNVFFDVFVTITETATGRQLTNGPSPSNPNPEPIALSMSFDRSNGPPEIDIFWMPAFLWFETPPGVPVEFWDLTGAPNPWDLVGPVHIGIPGMSWIPEPSLLGLFGLGLVGIYTARRARRA